MGDAALDQLVLQYLQKRNFLQAGRALKEEARLNSTDMSLKGGVNGVLDNLLLYLVADNEPEQYKVAFNALASWVDNSLDLYQVELARLLYPLFIHVYLRLVSKEASEAAAELFSRHKRRFAEATGVNSRTRLQELNELQTVAAPEHLQTHRIAQTVLGSPFPVRLCTYSFELLTSFLTSAKTLGLLLGILNEHIQVQVMEGLPVGPDQEEPEGLELLAGHVPGDTMATNHQALQLSLLQSSVELRWQRQQQAAHDRAEGDGGQKRKGKKAKAEPKAQEATQSTELGMAPEIPVVAVPERMQAGMLEDIAQRAALDGAALPSALFFTFLNTHQSLSCLAFSPDGARMAGGFADSSVRMHSLGSDAQPAAGTGPGPGSACLRGHTGAVYGLDFTPDQRLLLSASGDGTVRLWSTELAANLAAYRGHSFPVWDVAASPVGQYFASASADRVARIWVTERVLPLRILAGHYTDVDVVRWHPNGHYVATGSSDRTLRLWDIREGQSRRILAGHKSPVTSLAFSPDGRLAASGDEDGGVILWDLAMAKKLDASGGHTAAVWSLAFSHGEGTLLASGGADSSLKLWSAGLGQDKNDQSSAYAVRKALRTKATPVFGLHFTARNLLLAGGCLVPPGPRHKAISAEPA